MAWLEKKNVPPDISLGENFDKWVAKVATRVSESDLTICHSCNIGQTPAENKYFDLYSYFYCYFPPMDDSLASSIFHFSAVHFDVVDGANVYPEDFPPTASPAPSGQLLDGG